MMSPGDSPIVMYSLSDSPSDPSASSPSATAAAAAADLNLTSDVTSAAKGPATPRHNGDLSDRSNLKEKSPVKPVTSRQKTSARVSKRKRTGGAKIGSDSSSDEHSGFQGITEKEEEAVVREAAPAPRKLPLSMCNPIVEEQQTNRQEKKLLNNLRDAVEMLSGEFDESRYGGMDIMDIAKMKGIVFENPPWWPAEGYPDL